jgi:pimeloyl-ACP methyl ester carboxylesterase
MLIPIRDPRPDDDSLLVVPHAVMGTLYPFRRMFTELHRRNGPAVVAFQAPGIRQGVPLRRVADFAEAYAPELVGYLAEKKLRHIIVFGHCYGSYIAAELYRKLLPSVCHMQLVVSAPFVRLETEKKEIESYRDWREAAIADEFPADRQQQAKVALKRIIKVWEAIVESKQNYAPPKVDRNFSLILPRCSTADEMEIRKLWHVSTDSDNVLRMDASYRDMLEPPNVSVICEYIERLCSSVKFDQASRQRTR